MIAFTLILRRVLDGDGIWITLVAAVVAVFAMAVALSEARPFKTLAVGTVVSAALLLFASAH